jgi:hypothetical protein
MVSGRPCWRGVNGQKEKSVADLYAANGSGQAALMAELVALRAILLNVLFRQANGQTLTAEEMQGVIDRADAEKVRKARERLEQASDSKQR